MKPLILEFKECLYGEDNDFSSIEYSNILNLSVDKNTQIPAIQYLNLETETFTKTKNETSDSDKNALNFLMHTETGTFTYSEVSDSDRDVTNLKNIIDNTTTITESSDQDKPHNDINYYS